jgi:alpha,alpha-trehalase
MKMNCSSAKTSNVISIIAVLAVATTCFAGQPQCKPKLKDIEIDISYNLQRLLHEEDTDADKRITVDDRFEAEDRGDKEFLLIDTDSNEYKISGTYHLSSLLQELTLAAEGNGDTSVLNGEMIFEPPAERIDRQIRELYWDGLTRRIDEENLTRIFSDTKTQTIDGFNYVYVPHGDKRAYDYFREISVRRDELKMKVVRLPEEITADWVNSINGRHGILSLDFRRSENGGIEAVPFVVPGGRFNEMYGWDSYFQALGLLIDEMVDPARAMVDNFAYEIKHYGKILNANRSYYLTRSQPPFLTSMILAVFQRMPKNDDSRQWLKDSLTAAIDEYENVWTSPPRLTRTGLSRYYGQGKGVPPEVEPGHFDYIFRKYAEKHSMKPDEFEQAYKSGRIEDASLDEFFFHDRCMRESGHDKTYRWDDRCGDFLTVDLNCLLYKTETDIADILDKHFNSSLSIDDIEHTAEKWRQLAEKRKKLINEYCWSPRHGLFLDYDIKLQRRRLYITPVAFYPLWANLATDEQAASIVSKALTPLECPGGLAASTRGSRGAITENREQRQWDYPFGWAPHQMIAWEGLQNYGFDTDARRLIYRWLYTITSNAADYNGTVPEKFNVVTRSHKVFAEYGNVGTDFDYITKEGFGWMNASFKAGLEQLNEQDTENLNKLIPPEWIW